MGAINDCALGDPWKKASVKWAVTQERGIWRAGSQQTWRQYEQNLCSEGHVCVCLYVCACAHACVLTQSQKARGWHSQDTFNFHVLPHNLSRVLTARANPWTSSPAGRQGGRGMTPSAELSGSPERLSMELRWSQRWARARRAIWKLGGRELKRTTAEPFFLFFLFFLKLQ